MGTPDRFSWALKETCRDLDVKFGCTPFYLEAVKELNPYVDFFKVSFMKFYGINFLKRVAILANPLYFQPGWPMPRR